MWKTIGYLSLTCAIFIGLLISMALVEDGSFIVTPALSFTSNRSEGARKRLRPKPGFADRTIAALEGLVFRRIMPTGVVQ